MKDHKKNCVTVAILVWWAGNVSIEAQQWESYALPSNATVPSIVRQMDDRFIQGERQNGFRVGDNIVFSLVRPMYYDVSTGLIDTLPTPWPYSWNTFAMGEFGYSSSLGTVMLSGRTVHGRPPIFCLDDTWKSWSFTIDSSKSPNIRHGWRINRDERHYFEEPCGGEPHYLPDSVSTLTVEGVDQVNSHTLSFRFRDFALQTPDTGATWQHIDIRGGIGLNYVAASNNVLYSHSGYRHHIDSAWISIPVFRTANGDSLGVPTGHESNILLLWDSIPIIKITQPNQFVYTLDRGASWTVWEPGFLPYDTTFCANGDMLFGRLHRLSKGLPIRVEKLNLPIPLTAIREIEEGVLIGQSGNRLFKSDDGGYDWYDATKFVPEIPATSPDVWQFDFQNGRKRYFIGNSLVEEDPTNGRLYGRRTLVNGASLYDSVWYEANNFSTDYGLSWSRFTSSPIFDRKEYRYIAPDVFMVTGSTTHARDWTTIDARRALYRVRNTVVDTCTLNGYSVPIGAMMWARTSTGDTIDISFRGVSQVLNSGDSVVQSGGIARSVDGGLTFQRLTETDPSLTIVSFTKFNSRHLAVAGYFSTPGDTRYLELTTEWVELIQSLDGGRTWSTVAGTRSTSPQGTSRVLQSYNGTIVAVIGGRGPWFSTDGGVSFAPMAIETLPNVPITSMTLVGDTVLVITSAGCYRFDLTHLTSVATNARESGSSIDVVFHEDRLHVRSSSCAAIRSVALYDVLGRSVTLEGAASSDCSWRSSGSVQRYSGPMFIGVVTDDGSYVVSMLRP